MSATPLGFEDPRRVLARHGLRPKRSWSQNFLVSARTVERIARLVGDEHARVVELGAGAGTLTMALLRNGLEVVAVERDAAMLDVLRAELGEHPRLRLVAADAATVALEPLVPAAGAKLRVAGNLPYAASGAILRNLVTQYTRIEACVLMVQREVAERLVAAPATKAYGALTVFVSNVFEAHIRLRVPAGAFFPRPQVDSAVVKLVTRDAPRALPRPAWERVVRAAFQMRRKTLRNALAPLAPGDAAAVHAALERAGIDGQRRGETLGIEEFDAVARALDKADGE